MKNLSAVKTLFSATRPPSLIITIAPVVMATAMAFGDGIAHFPTAVVALIGGVLIHAGTNLINDYTDFKRGADRVGDFDPMRGILVGDVNPIVIKKAAVIAFALALIPAGYLINRGGWPIVMIAVLSFLAGIFYTAGRHPLAYVGGFGDLFVLVFFGPIAVAGTYYVQSLEINAAVILSGLAPGMITLGVLTINNIRDYDKDRAVGKKTLVVRFGRMFGYGEYLFSFLGAFLIPVLIYALIQDHQPILFAAALSWVGMPVVIKVLQAQNTPDFNWSIGATVRLLILYVIIFSIGWIV